MCSGIDTLCVHVINLHISYNQFFKHKTLTQVLSERQGILRQIMAIHLRGFVNCLSYMQIFLNLWNSVRIKFQIYPIVLQQVRALVQRWQFKRLVLLIPEICLIWGSLLGVFFCVCDFFELKYTLNLPF